MKPVDILLVILLNLLLAGNTIASKYSMGHFPALLFAALRYSMFALALTPKLKWHPGQMKILFVMGLTLGPLTLGLLLSGLRLSTSSVVAVTGQMIVPFAVLLSVILLKEKVTWWRWVGVLLAFGGVTYISFDPSVFKYVVGLSLVIAGALVAAFAAVYQRAVKVPVLELLAWVSLIGAPVLWIASFILEKGQWQAITTATLPIWASVVYVGLVATLIGDALYFHLIRKYHVSRITPLTLLNPLLTIAMGVAFMNDQLTPRMIVGSAVALVGVFIVTLQGKQPAVTPDLAVEGLAGDSEEKIG
jgi:O-acetylserine/cysteine efflux transporter